MKKNFSERYYSRLETLTDMAYLAGHVGFRYPDSRQTVETLIYWAQEFNDLYKGETWEELDYIETVDKFTELKILEELRYIEQQSLHLDDAHEYFNVCNNNRAIRKQLTGLEYEQEPVK